MRWDSLAAELLRVENAFVAEVQPLPVSLIHFDDLPVFSSEDPLVLPVEADLVAPAASSLPLQDLGPSAQVPETATAGTP